MAVETINIPIQSSTVKPFIKQGDTIDAYEIDIIEAGLDLTTCEIKMQLYNNSRMVMDISTGNGITILSATTFQIDTYNAAQNNLPEGVSTGDLEVTLPAVGALPPVRTTYFNMAYTITKQYTRP